MPHRSPNHPAQKSKALKVLRSELRRRYLPEKIAQLNAANDNRKRHLIADLIDESARTMTNYTLVGFNRVIYIVDEFEAGWNLILDAYPELKDELE